MKEQCALLPSLKETDLCGWHASREILSVVEPKNLCNCLWSREVVLCILCFSLSTLSLSLSLFFVVVCFVFVSVVKSLVFMPIWSTHSGEPVH